MLDRDCLAPFLSLYNPALASILSSKLSHSIEFSQKLPTKFFHKLPIKNCHLTEFSHSIEFSHSRKDPGSNPAWCPIIKGGSPLHFESHFPCSQFPEPKLKIPNLFFNQPNLFSNQLFNQSSNSFVGQSQSIPTYNCTSLLSLRNIYLSKKNLELFSQKLPTKTLIEFSHSIEFSPCSQVRVQVQNLKNKKKKKMLIITFIMTLCYLSIHRNTHIAVGI